MTVTKCSFFNYKPPSCFLSFHTLLLFCVDCHTFSPLLLSGTVSLFFVWMSHMRLSIFIVWMSHNYPCVSITFTWTLRFVSLWVITDPFSFLPCVDCHTSFLKWKIHLFYLFSQFWQYNKFIYNNFHISHAIIYLQFLVFFFWFLWFIYKNNFGVSTL